MRVPVGLHQGRKREAGSWVELDNRLLPDAINGGVDGVPSVFRLDLDSTALTEARCPCLGIHLEYCWIDGYELRDGLRAAVGKA